MIGGEKRRGRAGRNLYECIVAGFKTSLAAVCIAERIWCDISPSLKLHSRDEVFDYKYVISLKIMIPDNDKREIVSYEYIELKHKLKIQRFFKQRNIIWC